MKRIAKVQPAQPETVPAAPEKSCEEQNIVSIVVHSGLEKYSPVQYNSFELPPVTVQIGPLPGETPSQLYTRARMMVDGWSELEFDRKLKDHLRRVIATKKGQ